MTKNSELYKWPSWPCSYGSWIYNFLCNQCLSPIRAMCTKLCDKLCQWLAWCFL